MFQYLFNKYAPDEAIRLANFASYERNARDSNATPRRRAEKLESRY